MTTIFTKKEFIQMLQKALNDDQVVLLSRDVVGTLSVNQKKNQKTITFAYAADAFKESDTIADILSNRVSVCSFAFADRKNISDQSLQKLAGSKAVPVAKVTKQKIKNS
jgi:hypothetical protein